MGNFTDKMYDLTLDHALQNTKQDHEMLFESVQVLNESEHEEYVVSGVIAVADVVNRNNRLYSSAVLKDALAAYDTKFVSEGAAYGELDHPLLSADAPVQLKNASHLITSVSFDDETATARATIKVLDTPSGKTLRALFESSGKVGISSRGLADSEINADGVSVVLAPLTLIGFDFVSLPAAADAMIPAQN